MSFKCLIPLIISFFASCGAPQNRTAHLAFIHDYGRASFAEFKGYSVFVRSYENLGNNTCIMIVDNEPASNCKIPYTLVIENSTLRVAEVRGKTAGDQSCRIDSATAQHLAVQLLRMKIHGIGVDSNNTVFVNIGLNEDNVPELIRYPNPQFITATNLKLYKPVGGNWYERLK